VQESRRRPILGWNELKKFHHRVTEVTEKAKKLLGNARFSLLWQWFSL
jgi:hypothetical protein